MFACWSRLTKALAVISIHGGTPLPTRSTTPRGSTFGRKWLSVTRRSSSETGRNDPVEQRVLISAFIRHEKNSCSLHSISKRFHAGRIARRHRHHCHPCRSPAPGTVGGEDQGKDRPGQTGDGQPRSGDQSVRVGVPAPARA